MNWNRGRLIFEQDPKSGLTHAANPTAIRLSFSTYRIFFSTRNRANQSVIAAFDYNLSEMFVERTLPELVFDELTPDSFYQDGLGLGSAFYVSGSWYLYFMGWKNPPGGAHWQGEIGRLRLDDKLEKGEMVERHPVLGISDLDATSVSYPWIVEGTGTSMEMWYGTTHSWDYGNGEMLHVLRRASSENGLRWYPRKTFLPYEIGVMQAFSRPSILRVQEGVLEMYFSYRGAPPSKYKIGRAFSGDNGETWTHLGEVAGLISGEAWDSEMREYPFVFFHEDVPFMLYNGNAYGKTGIGLSTGEVV